MQIKTPCMDDGVCSKKYPKSFCEETVFNDDGFPRYRRRNDGRQIKIERRDGTVLVVDN